MIDRSEPADGQTIGEWWDTLEAYSRNEHGEQITAKPMTTKPSEDWDRRNFPELYERR